MQTNERDSTQRKEYIKQGSNFKTRLGLVLKDGAIYFLKGENLNGKKMYEIKDSSLKVYYPQKNLQLHLKRKRRDIAAVEHSVFF